MKGRDKNRVSVILLLMANSVEMCIPPLSELLVCTQTACPASAEPAYR